MGFERGGGNALKVVAWLYENSQSWKPYFSFKEVLVMVKGEGMLGDSRVCIRNADGSINGKLVSLMRFISGVNVSVFDPVFVLEGNATGKTQVLTLEQVRAIREKEFFYPYTGLVATEFLANKVYLCFRVSLQIQKDLGKFL